MADGTLAPLLLTVAVMLGVARATGWLFTRAGQPAVIGEILGGLLLGPTVLGAVAPAVQRLIVPALATDRGDGIDLLASLGLLVVMYSAGTRAVARVPRADGRTILAVALLGMAIPFALGLVVMGSIDLGPILGPARSTTALELVLATVIAITSVPVIARILTDLGLGDTRFARLVLVVGVLEDLALYAILGIAIGLAAPQGGSGLTGDLHLDAGSVLGVAVYAAVTAGLLAAAFFVARAGLWPRVASRLTGAGELSTLLCLIGLGIAAASYLGVNSAFAALMVGIATAGTGCSTPARPPVATIEAIGSGGLVPLYFASVGAGLDLAADLQLTFTLELVVIGCMLKATSVYLGARLAGEPPAIAGPLAVALNARGGQGIIAATLARSAGIVNDAGFASIVVLALATSALAGWWLRLRRDALLSPATPKTTRAPEPAGGTGHRH